MTAAETPVFRANIRDPLVERLIGPGKLAEIETVDVGGYPREVIKGAPRNLAGLYRQAMQFGARTLVVHEGVSREVTG